MKRIGQDTLFLCTEHGVVVGIYS